ncbi:bifunctional ornithine acetyltransferase/N-acetylglutamate synthase [Brevirhabdus pacifica]|uniref:Arginine biosynthesis bifunctional protein ArgJ n=1 Tax=Brevirhabdus pacifica TaxID=1267768 RepID=A0A1U7DM47_9RHOB|nr:bifunctional ornithine acetyltransferase/N-acetylglutamate synthase [Brevirhabdus pacifica]OWU74494.1 N-acetylglutamate synthase [Loktanella sp. 22II-4b]
MAPKGGFPALPVIEGARFAAAAAGVRYTTGRLDVALMELCAGSTVAAVFTRSATRAAPVLDGEEKLARIATGSAGSGDAGFAIIVNAGNANAFTGAAGSGSVEAVSKAVGERLGIPAGHVFMSSTGVIGEPLKHERIVAVLDGLKSDLDGAALPRAAEAIRTTDTFAKGASAEVAIGGGTVRIAGIAKGSGMIAPDMATMLVYLFTDAPIDQPLLQAMVSRASDRTFNCITVDGDTSTSDTLICGATGKAKGVARLTDAESDDARAFEKALHGVMLDLAHQVVRDGEGATKFVEVRVTGARSDEDARKVALATANSPLVKTALAGEDPNWGRIVMAVGKSGAEADRDRLAIRLGDLTIAEKGWVAEGYREEDGAAYMKRDELVIGIDLGLGDGESVVWTCDLTHQYITINADYRS